MTFIFSCAKVSNNRLEKPGIPTIPLPCSVNKEIPLTLLIPLIGLELPFYTSLVIRVPSSSGAIVFLMRIGIFLESTGNTVGGYNTFAPKCDSSMASK